MEKIKLVIWDLDETFWSGTLSEGEIHIIPENIAIVKELSRRGIVNSISSKNDFEAAKAKLIEAGIWDYFIFPSINWNPKGENVRNIIADCQLRAPNILFIDDNVSNRKEVEHYNEGINTLSEAFINQLLSMPELKGKDDSSLSRLKQYKILEKKQEARAEYSDNKTFLRESDIKLRFIHDCKAYKERILELINRTNQLNFTKVRLEVGQLDSLLNDTSLDNGCIEVRDKFGDYGICGFYSLDKCANELRHFLFSCRILNLGIETYVYKKLGCPKVSVVGPVASSLTSQNEIDWISEVENFEGNKEKEPKKGRIRLLMLGGCDLEQMCHYIDDSKFEIIKEFNYPNRNGVPVHREHSAYLCELESLSENEKQQIAQLPFGDAKMLESIIFSNDYDVLVYSVLMNYTHELYENRVHKFKVAYGGYMDQQTLCDYLKMPANESEQFCRDYLFLGLQKPQDFKSELGWLLKRLNRPVIFINGAETPDVCNDEPLASERHVEMNKALDEFVAENADTCGLIDVRKFVKAREDHKDTIRHYQRPIYIKMSEELMTIISGNKVKVKKSTLLKCEVEQVRAIIRGFLGKIKQKVLYLLRIF